MKNMTLQKAALIFAWIFFIVFVITNIPAFNDAEGRNFGLFKIDPIDNWVHLLTAIIGFLAARYSEKFAKLFLIIGGEAYMLDAAVGISTQRGLLDLSLFFNGIGSPDLGLTNIALNLPHIGIAGLMIIAGFLLHKKDAFSTQRENTETK